MVIALAMPLQRALLTCRPGFLCHEMATVCSDMKVGSDEVDIAYWPGTYGDTDK